MMCSSLLYETGPKINTGELVLIDTAWMLSSVAAQKHPILQRLSFCERLGLKKKKLWTVIATINILVVIIVIETRPLDIRLNNEIRTEVY